MIYMKETFNLIMNFEKNKDPIKRYWQCSIFYYWRSQIRHCYKP